MLLKIIINASVLLTVHPIDLHVSKKKKIGKYVGWILNMKCHKNEAFNVNWVNSFCLFDMEKVLRNFFEHTDMGLGQTLIN